MLKKFNDLSLMTEVLHGARTGLWIIELEEGKDPRMYADTTMQELLGFTQEPEPEECYQVWYDRIEEEYYPVVQKCVDEMVSQRRAEVQYPWHHPLLGRIFVRCGGILDTSYTSGLRLRGYHQDITDTIVMRQKKVELEEFNAEMVGAMHHLFYAIYRIDMEKLSVRPVKMAGDSEEGLSQESDYSMFVNRFQEQLFSPEDKARMREEFSVGHMKELMDRGIDRFTAEYRKKAGTEYRWISCTVYFEPESNIRHGVLLALQDIHEQKQKEEEQKKALWDACYAAKSANRAKSDFLSRMSHDIRTPMNAIIGMTNLAVLHLDDRERVKDCLDKIDVSSRLLLNLVNEVLDMSKIDSGKFELSSKEFCLTELCRGMISMIKPAFQEKRQKLFSNMDTVKHDLVIGDPVRIQQVFMNIMSNANKYTPEGGTIIFTLEELDDAQDHMGKYQFRFQDNGIGMSTEFLQTIFEPFTRAQDSRMKETAGTGLGMAITQNIVQMMNGVIEVESSRHTGSTFTVIISLKLQENDNAPIAVPGADIKISDLHFENKVILLVEDNDMNLEIAREIIRMSGASVETAQNGEEGLKKFSLSPPWYYSAVFMDIQMPVLNGYEASRQIRGLFREDADKVPIFAMTANAFVEDVAAAKNAGMNEHIAKPIDIKHLTAVMHKWIK